MTSILDVNLWPKNQTQISTYCDLEIKSLWDHFEALLELNQCVISSICNKWDCLKAFILPMITGVDSIDYLEIWPKLLTKDVQASCSNVLHIIELLLITPFTNVKLERMFSRLNCIKTDYCNHLGQERLKHLLQIGEEGLETEEFDTDVFMGFWYHWKVRWMKAAKPHKYPKKWKSNQISSGIMDIKTYTLSNLGEEEEGDLSNDN